MGYLFLRDEARALTDDEQKEVLKLHRYFAHRSGAKLWEKEGSERIRTCSKITAKELPKDLLPDGWRSRFS